LVIEGRTSDIIITGGKKVAPTEVEAALLATGLLADVCVLGLPDAEWGQIVAAFYPGVAIDVEKAVAALRGHLAGYKLPKRWIAMADWPRNEQGKVNRARLAEIGIEPAR
jgi:O-succinylbenzoic acid--CoA ligase